MKDCPSDKILNPATKRCVSKTGAVGKKLLMTSVKKPKVVICPPGKILNPATNKCVSKTGAIGKKLLMTGVKKSKSPQNTAAKIIQRKLKGFMYPFVNRVTTNINDRVVYFRKLIKHLKVDVNSKNNCLEYTGTKDGKPVYKIGDNIILKNQIGSNNSYGIVYLGGFKDAEGKLYKYAIKVAKTVDVKKEILILQKLRSELLNHTSPHFPFLYAVLNCESKYYDNFDSSIKIILNELANGDLKAFIHNHYNNDNLMKNALIQTVLSLFSFYMITGMYHSNSHWGNFLYHKIKPGGYIHYKIEGRDYYLENLGYLWVIWGFGLATSLTNKSITSMSQDISLLLTAFVTTDTIGFLKAHKYNPKFNNNVKFLLSNYMSINSDVLYNLGYSREGMKLMVSSIFKDFAKLGWISTTPPSDRKLIINDKPYVISF